MRTFVKQNQILLYFVLTLIIGWFPWYSGNGGLIIAAPTLSAIIIAFISSGWEGVLKIFKRLGRWRSKYGWYLFALLTPAIIYLIAIGIHSLIGGTSPNFPMFKENQGMLALTFIFFLLPWQSSAFLEEVGFRGYALEKLQEKWGPLVGTLVLGLFFGGWLLPEFYREGSAQMAMGSYFFLLIYNSRFLGLISLSTSMPGFFIIFSI